MSCDNLALATDMTFMVRLTAQNARSFRRGLAVKCVVTLTVVAGIA